MSGSYRYYIRSERRETGEFRKHHLHAAHFQKPAVHLPKAAEIQLLNVAVVSFIILVGEGLVPVRSDHNDDHKGRPYGEINQCLKNQPA